MLVLRHLLLVQLLLVQLLLQVVLLQWVLLQVLVLQVLVLQVLLLQVLLLQLLLLHLGSSSTQVDATVVLTLVVVVSHHSRVGEVMTISQCNGGGSGVVQLLVVEVLLLEVLVLRSKSLASRPLIGSGRTRHGEIGVVDVVVLNCETGTWSVFIVSASCPKLFLGRSNKGRKFTNGR